MFDQFTRTRLLVGDEALEKLALSKVAVFGVGGVGSFAAEALARGGVGNLALIDYDVISLTNINRQIHATHRTIGQPKTTVMKERILEINPKAEVAAVQKMCDKDNSGELLDNDYDYIIDAIDMVSSKIDLIIKAKERRIPIISSMGAGNKLDPAKFETADIYRTSVCPLAKIVRRELRKRGVTSLKVVYSREEPIRPLKLDWENGNDLKERTLKERIIPGSISFVPPAAGLIIAGEVIKDIIEWKSR